MNKQDMQIKFLNYMIQSSNKFAIRGLRTNNHGSTEKIFRDVEEAVDFANEMDQSGKYKGVYFAINPVKDDYNGSFVKDGDIARRNILFIDIDAQRHPAPPLEGHKVSSTPDELQATLDMANDVAAYLSDCGFNQEPVIAISGNGAHIYYPIDMANDDRSLDTLKYFLKHLMDKFNGERGEIDQTIRNAARIAKMTGTMATKGEDGVEPGRNHRMAEVTVWPSVSPDPWHAAPVDACVIEELADIAREAEAEKKKAQTRERVSKHRTKNEGTQTNPRPSRQQKETKMNFINRADFILDQFNQWLPAAYEQVAAPDDRNQWLGTLTSVKAILGEAGWTAFDAWCQTSSHYDESGNRQAWERPAVAEDIEQEKLKLAYSFMKMGVDFDAIAEGLGYELSKGSVMSIDEIKHHLEMDNSLTVRWGWIPSKGKYIPVNVWSKDINARRLDYINMAAKVRNLSTLFMSTEVGDNGFFNLVKPVMRAGTDDLFMYDEDAGVWKQVDEVMVSDAIRNQEGLAITGKKGKEVRLFHCPSVEAETREIFRGFVKDSLNGECKVAFRDVAKFFDTYDGSIVTRKPVASDLFTSRLDISLQDEVATPEFDAALNRLLENDPERIECFLQWAGATIMGAAAHYQLPMLILSSIAGGTGKSMLLKLMMHIMGSDRSIGVALDRLSDRQILINNANKALMVVPELDLSRSIDNVDILKSLMTGDAMQQRVIGSKTTVEVRYRGAMCGAANGNPTFRSYDAGIDRRLLIMPTTNIVMSSANNIHGYEVRLFRKEGAGIVHKMLAAFDRLVANNGAILIPEVCKAAKEELRSEVDVVSTWLFENFEFDEEAPLVHIKDLYHNYRAWCANNGHIPQSSTRFVKEIKSKAITSNMACLSQMKGYPAIRISHKEEERRPMLH